MNTCIRCAGFLFCAGLIALLSSCDLLSAEEELPFPWLRNDLWFRYHFYPVAETLTVEDRQGDLVRLDTTLNSEQAKPLGMIPRQLPEFKWWELSFIHTCNSCWFPSSLRLKFGYNKYERRADGLYAPRPEGCGLVEMREDLRFLLRVPASPPRVGTKLRHYLCNAEEMILYVSEVVSVDEEVEADDGKVYRTYVLETRKARSEPTPFQREYWSEENGRIKLELYREDGALMGYYVLAAKVYNWRL